MGWGGGREEGWKHEADSGEWLEGLPCLDRRGFPMVRVSMVEVAAPTSINFGVSTIVHNSGL